MSHRNRYGGGGYQGNEGGGYESRRDGRQGGDGRPGAEGGAREGGREGGYFGRQQGGDRHHGGGDRHHNGGGGYGRGYHTSNASSSATNDVGNRRHQQGSSGGDNQFAVMDMGLDFRSYQHILDEATNAPALGNVVLFPVDKIPDVFQPTVGLLVAIVHMYSVSRTHETARIWLGVYETVQMLHQGSGQAREDGKYAIAAVKSIKSHASSQHPDRKLTERLLTLLDSQSGMPSGQLPSQRRIPPNPKGTFCNLHLSDHKCNLDFACNQIHLHEVGPSVKHRVDFHVRMVNLLVKAGTSREEIVHRVKDSLFYAKFGNRVTVRCNNMSIPFFKTLYTPDRLDAALGRCPRRPFIQAQDNVQSSKPLELHTPVSEVDVELEHGCAEVFAAIDQPQTPKNAPASPTMSHSSAHGPSLMGPSLMDSPTLDPWESTVRDYVRESGIHDNHVTEQLLLTLQAGASTSSNPAASQSDSFTPLMREAMRSMESDTSADTFDDLP